MACKATYNKGKLLQGPPQQLDCYAYRTLKGHIKPLLHPRKSAKSPQKKGRSQRKFVHIMVQIEAVFVFHKKKHVCVDHLRPTASLYPLGHPTWQWNARASLLSGRAHPPATPKLGGGTPRTGFMVDICGDLTT